MLILRPVLVLLGAIDPGDGFGVRKERLNVVQSKGRLSEDSLESAKFHYESVVRKTPMTMPMTRTCR